MLAVSGPVAMAGAPSISPGPSHREDLTIGWARDGFAARRIPGGVQDLAGQTHNQEART